MSRTGAKLPRMIPIKGKTHDLGDGFMVARMLPQAARRSVGPFLFFDYFGPVDFPPGKGVGTVRTGVAGADVGRGRDVGRAELADGAVPAAAAGEGVASAPGWPRARSASALTSTSTVFAPSPSGATFDPLSVTWILSGRPVLARG